MSDTAATPVYWALPIGSGSELVQVQMQLFALVVAADHPAAAVMGPWARSVSARRFDRRSLVDRDGDWKQPNSYLDDNPDLTQLWQLRTSEQLKEHERMYEGFKSNEGLESAAAFLREIGVNAECAFDYPLKPLPHISGGIWSLQPRACSLHLPRKPGQRLHRGGVQRSACLTPVRWLAAASDLRVCQGGPSRRAAKAKRTHPLERGPNAAFHAVEPRGAGAPRAARHAGGKG